MRVAGLCVPSSEYESHPVVGTVALLGANHLVLGAKTYHAGRAELSEDAPWEGEVSPESCGQPAQGRISCAVGASDWVMKLSDGQ